MLDVRGVKCCVRIYGGEKITVRCGHRTEKFRLNLAVDFNAAVSSLFSADFSGRPYKINIKSLISDLQRYKRKVLGAMWSSHPTQIDVRRETEDVR